MVTQYTVYITGFGTMLSVSKGCTVLLCVIANVHLFFYTAHLVNFGYPW